MARLDKKIGYFLLVLIITIVAIDILYPEDGSKLHRIGISAGLTYILIYFFFKKNLVFYSLKPLIKIYNWPYALIITLVLLVYCIYSVNFFDYQNKGWFVLYILTIGFLQTLMEELIFRGILLNNYLKNGASIIKSVLYSSIFFGLFHLTSFLRTDNINAVINQVIIAILLGVFLASVFIVCKNIYFVAFLHLLINIPAYFNRIAIPTMEEESISSDFNIIDSIISLLGVMLVYSPLLLFGLFLLSRVNKKRKIAKEDFKIEKAFLP